MPTPPLTDKDLLQRVRTCLENRELMAALAQIIAKDDVMAIQTLQLSRVQADQDEATQVLRHNERFRHWFRVAAEGKDPFNV